MYSDRSQQNLKESMRYIILPMGVILIIGCIIKENWETILEWYEALKAFVMP